MVGELRRADMANIVGKAAILIDRPADVVWDWVVNPANMPLWVHDVDEPGNWIDEGSASAGSKYRIDYKYGRKTNEIIFEVLDADRGNSFIVNTVEGPYPILVEYGFDSTNDGSGTNLTINMNARSDSAFTAAMFVVTGWFAKWFMKRRLKNELEDVKAEVEKI